VTEPVGAGFPAPPLTVTVTSNDCDRAMLAAPGVTVTVGLIRGATYVAVTVALAFISTVHVAPVVVEQPVHDENTVPFVPDTSGAVIVTVVPWL
jgi:hypothetical protein